MTATVDLTLTMIYAFQALLPWYTSRRQKFQILTVHPLGASVRRNSIVTWVKSLLRVVLLELHIIPLVASFILAAQHLQPGGNYNRVCVHAYKVEADENGSTP